MEAAKKCRYCHKELSGRSDKKFCDPHCKSALQYQNSKKQPQRFYNTVDNLLRRNRKLLKEYNKAGKSIVRAKVLLEAGFDPRFFTHYWKNQKGDLYRFVYEYGFLKKTENQKTKYVLVSWQDYMAQKFGSF